MIRPYIKLSLRHVSFWMWICGSHKDLKHVIYLKVWVISRTLFSFRWTTVMADIFQEGFWKRSNIFPGSHEKKKLKKKSKSEVIRFDTAWFIAFGRYYVHPPTCVHATNTKININITFLMKMPQEEFSVCIVRYLT